MDTAPYAPGGFCCALDVAAFKRPNFSARRIKEKGDFFLDASYFETIKGNDLVSVIH